MKGRAVLCGWLLVGCAVLRAQQPIGSVAAADATVSGALEVTGARTVLVGSSVVVARDHAAEIKLERGGVLMVCQTSGLHVTPGGALKGTGVAVAPLLLALDRGAMEVRMDAVASDVLMTPDLRFGVRAPGPMDVRIRVTRNGDTCVENRGDNAPVLGITSQFGDAAYELKAGQHVLFEHGDLRQVVDHEASACGCPPPSPAAMSVAEALLRPGAGAGKSPAEVAAAEHPFPAAVSQGLAPEGAVPQAPAGVAHAQVATTLSYGAEAPAASSAPGASSTPAASSAPAAGPAPAPQTSVAAAPAAAKRKSRNPIRVVGRFFRRLFGGGTG